MKTDISHIPQEFHEPTGVWYRMAHTFIHKGPESNDYKSFKANSKPSFDPTSFAQFMAHLKDIGSYRARTITLAYYLSENLDLWNWPLRPEEEQQSNIKYPPQKETRSKIR